MIPKGRGAYALVGPSRPSYNQSLRHMATTRYTRTFADLYNFLPRGHPGSPPTLLLVTKISFISKPSNKVLNYRCGRGCYDCGHYDRYDVNCGRGDIK